MFMFLMPAQGAPFDVFDESMELVVEPSQDGVVISQVDMVIESFDFEIRHEFELESWVENYSLISVAYIQLEEFTSYSQDLNIKYITDERLQLTINRMPINRQPLRIYYNLDEGRLYSGNLYSTGNFLHEHTLFHGYKYSFSEVLIC